MTHQTTIERPVATQGVGLHTAVKSHLRLVPAPADTGIVFRRTDLDNFEIEAHVRNVARVSYAKKVCCFPPPNICWQRCIPAASIMCT